MSGNRQLLGNKRFMKNYALRFKPHLLMASALGAVRPLNHAATPLSANKGVG